MGILSIEDSGGLTNFEFKEQDIKIQIFEIHNCLDFEQPHIVVLTSISNKPTPNIESQE
jgi:hypothetical protein